MNKKAGFASIALIILAIVVVGGLGYLLVFTKKAVAPREGQVVAENPEPVPPATPPSSLPTTCTDELAEGIPVITSVSSISGPVGTKIEIKGCNFAGFEGDKTVWIQDSEGVKGILAGDPGSTAKLLKLTLRSPLCQKDNSYSGLPCEAWLNLVPGIYKIYTEPWGKRSNEVSFTIQ